MFSKITIFVLWLFKKKNNLSNFGQVNSLIQLTYSREQHRKHLPHSVVTITVRVLGEGSRKEFIPTSLLGTKRKTIQEGLHKYLSDSC